LNDTLEIDTIYPYPSKVAIITNRWDASTTEGFTLIARQSKKVTQYGENTGGMISYGNLRKVEMPCLPIYFSLTTTKMYFRNNEDFESIGLEPKKKLDIDKQDKWVEIVQKDIEK
jgi:C-terminal processing protease CtpA/Prc